MYVKVLYMSVVTVLICVYIYIIAIIKLSIRLFADLM